MTARVCLVRCPTVSNVGAVGQDAVPPLGLAYIAAALKRAGHHVIGVDAVGEAVNQYTRIPWTAETLAHGLTTDEVVARIPANIDIIGVSCMFSVEWMLLRELIGRLRHQFPAVPIVLGGEHATACPEYSLQDSAADVCVLGEGESTIVELVDALTRHSDLSDVSGIVYRGPDGPVRTTTRPRIRPVETIAEPDWAPFPIKTYLDQHLSFGVDLGRSMPILASRGCPFQCTFCSSPQMWTTLWTARKPEEVLAEMKGYIAQYGVTNFDFYDLTAIVDKRWIRAFSTLLIEERLGITWQLPSGTRSEALDAEVCQLLYASGCRVINYAPESGSPEELRRIKKKVDPTRMLTSMRGACAAGLQVKANFIFGLPGMRWRDVFHTWGFVARMAAVGVHDMNAFPFSPYPGSELFAGLVGSGRVRFDESYFRSLLAYTDPAHSVSYCDTVGSRSLSWLCLASMAFFYAVSSVRRPSRGWRLLRAVIGQGGNTKLSTALSTRRRKQRALRAARLQQSGTVVVE